MKRVAVFLAVVATSAACGSFLAANAEDPQAATDAGAADADAGADTTSGEASVETDAGVDPPKVPRVCPLRTCPGDDMPGDDCSDDACAVDGLDWNVNGTVDTNSGVCTATAGGVAQSFTFNDRTTSTAGRYVAVSFDVRAFPTSDRTIASIFIQEDPGGEHFEVVLKSDVLLLCERGGGPEKCTDGIPKPPPGRLHLYGVVSSASPARGSLALAGPDCTAPQFLPVTRPFPDGAIVGAIGCLAGAGDCVLTYDDAVLFTANE